jgi:hypothetical protein
MFGCVYCYYCIACFAVYFLFVFVFCIRSDFLIVEAARQYTRNDFNCYLFQIVFSFKHENFVRKYKLSLLFSCKHYFGRSLHGVCNQTDLCFLGIRSVVSNFFLSVGRLLLCV